VIQGKERMIDLRIVPFAGAAAEIEGVLLLGEDATEELKTKERLLQSERLATVGRMAAQVAHEIRNPLSSIGLNTELLEDDLAEIAALAHSTNLTLPRLAQDQKLLKAIQKEVDHLAAITEDYLKYARLPQPQRNLGELNAVVRSLCDFYAEETKARKVSLSLSLSDELPQFRFDEAQLRQSLSNLLRNAFEALSEKGNHVEIHTALNGTFAEISISDDGPGIPTEIAPKIFEPFFSTKSGGTGLGLALTRQVIEGHGGSIRLKTAPEQGTVFLIQLPLS
jgi:signal transduction histidine kinase